MSADLAAVVMAAGLGTRMRSAVPKHLHPLLGRRMVDWVLDAARDAGADPIVVVASPDTRDAFDGVEVAVQEQPRGTGDAVRVRARRARGLRAATCSSSTATRRCVTPDLLRELVATHRARGAAATVLSFEPPTSRCRTAASSATRTGSVSEIVEAARRDRRASSSSARSTPRSTSSTRRRSGPRSSGSSRRTRRASST